MAWLWSSWEEFVDYVQPVAAKNRGLFRIARNHTTFEIECDLYKALEELSAALRSLVELGFKGRDNERRPDDVSLVDEARRSVIDLVHAGETLLLHHKRLAQSDDAYGFLSQHDILEHWERYGPERLLIEIDQLVTDASELTAGFYRMKSDDEKFLIYHLDLPSELESDFRLARNLFSIGIDEVGVFMVGRGFEMVLRSIAKSRKIMISHKNQIEPAAEADLFDLIEAMARLRWKRTSSKLITNETKALLHYLRATRNNNAHPNFQGTRSAIGTREIASLVTETAGRLWKDVTGTRAKFTQTTINKSW
jgi:hypothetical protein